MKNFLKENWFYLMIGISIVVFSFSFLVYVFIEKKDCSESEKEVLKEGWSELDKKVFKEGCMQGWKFNAAFINNNDITQNDIKNYCECSLKEIIKVYPDNQDSDEATIKELIEISKACLYILKN